MTTIIRSPDGRTRRYLVGQDRIGCLWYLQVQTGRPATFVRHARQIEPVSEELTRERAAEVLRELRARDKACREAVRRIVEAAKGHLKGILDREKGETS